MYISYKRGSPTSRFLSKIDKTDTCWIWLAYKDAKGYGIFGISSRNTKRAHRFSYELFINKIPHDKLVCHECDNPSCVNPEHLFLGTNQDNMDDMKKKNRAPNNKGTNNPNAKLNKLKAVQIRKLYKTGEYLIKDLAERFSINRNRISKVISNKYL